MTTPFQQPAVYNAGVGYPVNDSVDGNLALVDVYGTGQYGNLTARSVTAPFRAGLNPSGDQVNSTDVANINNLLGTFGVTDLKLGPGQWYGKTQVTIPVSSILRGSGPSTFWNYSGSGSAFYQHDINGTGGGGFGTYHTAAGGVRDMTIDGSSAGNGAVGLDIGDGWGYRVEDVRIQNFNGTGSIGLWLNNQFGWTEKGRFQATLWGNSTQCVLNGNNGGLQSFEFNSLDFDVFVFAGQNGVSVTNGAYLNKATLRMVGNFLAGASSLATNFVLQFTGSAPGSNSRMLRGIIDINIELDNTQANPPQTINFGAAANKITDCAGSLVFDPSATPVSFLPSNAVAGQFTFDGPIVGDTVLQSVNSPVQGTPAAPVNVKPADPTSTASTSLVMMGCGSSCSYTPQSSGLVTVTVTGWATTLTAVTVFTVGARYGTGTAPANGTADNLSSWHRFGANGDPTPRPPVLTAYVAIAFTDVLQLVAGTTYWFDFALATGTAGDNAQIKQISMSFAEGA